MIFKRPVIFKTYEYRPEKLFIAMALAVVSREERAGRRRCNLGSSQLLLLQGDLQNEFQLGKVNKIFVG